MTRTRRRSRCASRSSATEDTSSRPSTALDDGQLLQFRNELLDQIGRYRRAGRDHRCRRARRPRLLRVPHPARSPRSRACGARRPWSWVSNPASLSQWPARQHPSPGARTRPRGGARPPRPLRRPGGRRPPDMVSSDPGCARTTLRRSPGSSSTGRGRPLRGLRARPARPGKWRQPARHRADPPRGRHRRTAGPRGAAGTPRGGRHSSRRGPRVVRHGTARIDRATRNAEVMRSRPPQPAGQRAVVTYRAARRRNRTGSSPHWPRRHRPAGHRQRCADGGDDEGPIQVLGQHGMRPRHRGTTASSP